MTQHVTVDQDRCKGCNLCVEVCPNKLFVSGGPLNAQGHRVVVMIDTPYCTACLDCVQICPDNALIPPRELPDSWAGRFYWVGRQLGKLPFLKKESP